MAAASLEAISGEVIEPKFSMPSGKQTSDDGNLRLRSVICGWIDCWNKRALDGVVMMVALTPRVAKRLAVSTRGIRWLVTK